MRLDPFPGLRPFTEKESHIFFGREGQSDELMRKLARRRFLAVVGSSGSGKSSLVRAGLLPSLRGGYLASAGSDWHVVDFAPGRDPVGNLAAALTRVGLATPAVTPEALRASSLALVNIVAQARADARIADGENVLVLVDQFEEIFRLKARATAMADRDEKACFIALLIEAARSQLPVYLVITMRSDFLGDCAKFRDLPEIINDGQYLIPRMTRPQRRAAIEGPIRLAGGEIAPRLVQRVLNESGEDPEQLPVLQHALLRTWVSWREQPGSASRPIDFVDYERIGTLSEALDRHVDEARHDAERQVPERGPEIVKRVFQRLRERDANGRETRRPTTFQELCAVAEATPAELARTLDCFRQPGRTFLRPPLLVPFGPETDVDVSHECLFWQWRRLVDWIRDEEDSRREYVRLSDRTHQHVERGPDFLSGAPLQLTLEWWNRRKPTKSWADRYDAGCADACGFVAVEGFLRDSDRRERAERERKAREERRALVRSQRLAWVFAVLFVAALVSLGFAIFERNKAQSLTERLQKALSAAEAAERRAEEALVLAQDAVDNAKAHRAEAIWSSIRAKEQEQIALREKGNAEANLALADTRAQALAENEQQLKRALGESEDRGQKLAESEKQLKAEKQLAERATKDAIDATAREKSLKLQASVRALAAKARSVTQPAEWESAALFARQAFELNTKAVGDANAPDPDTQRQDLAEIHAGLHAALELRRAHRPGGSPAIQYGPAAAVRAVALHGRRLAVGREDGSLRLVTLPELADEAALAAPSQPGAPQPPLRALAWNSTGQLVAAGGIDGSIRVWSLSSRQPRRFLFPAAAHTGPVTALTFTADGRLVSGSQDGQVRVWRRRPLGYLAGESVTAPCRVHALAVSPDGKRIVAGGDMGVIEWNLQRLTESSRLLDLPCAAGPQQAAARTSVSALAFDRSGRLIVGTRDGRVGPIDRATREIAGQRAHAASVTALSVGPTGLLASSGLDGHVLLWQLMPGTPGIQNVTPWARVGGERAWMWAVASSADGIVSGDESGRIRIWVPDAKRMADEVCRVTSRELRAEEWRPFGAPESYRPCPGRVARSER